MSLPAYVVLVHDDPEFSQKAATALRQAGYLVRDFSNALDAYEAMRESILPDLLITSVSFGQGQLHGVALARMARFRSSKLRVLFIARSDFRDEAERLGAFITMPVEVSVLLERVEHVLRQR